MKTLSPHLHLVDFSSATPTSLQGQVISAIDDANAFLDGLSATTQTDAGSAGGSAEQALIDVMNFDHINRL